MTLGRAPMCHMETLYISPAICLTRFPSVKQPQQHDMQRIRVCLDPEADVNVGNQGTLITHSSVDLCQRWTTSRMGSVCGTKYTYYNHFCFWVCQLQCIYTFM